MILFFATWIAHGIAEWQVYTDHQREVGQPTRVGDFVGEFAQATLENWQSEFLQLFAFVTLAALYIHKSSAESKDGDERLEASLRRIEQQLGTLPDDAPTEPGNQWKLPDTALEARDASPRGCSHPRSGRPPGWTCRPRLCSAALLGGAGAA